MCACLDRMNADAAQGTSERDGGYYGPLCQDIGVLVSIRWDLCEHGKRAAVSLESTKSNRLHSSVFFDFIRNVD